jgi:hypothetical protein
LRKRESPSIIPWGDLDRDVYLVLDNFGGKYGWPWPETNVTDTDRATLIRWRPQFWRPTMTQDDLLIVFLAAWLLIAICGVFLVLAALT